MTPLPSNADREHDFSRPDIPLASQRPPSSILLSASRPPALAPDAPPPPILTSTMHSPPSKDSHLLLPIPILPTNHSQPSFSRIEALCDATDLDPLPPEIASADISVAPDGTFVETSSGLAARELKKRYDQRLGVGLSVRSPYAITAFVNQHGKQMYRVSHRELSAPAAQAEDFVSLSKSPSTKSDSQSSRSKRRSRLSMHVLLPPSMFKNINGSMVPRPLTTGGPSRKLRKTRSIPDMFEFAGGTISPTFASTPADSPWSQYPPGRAHAHSVSGAMSTFPVPSLEAPQTPVRSGDIFADVMNSSSSTQSLIFSSEGGMSPTIIVHPFGAGVSFDSPARPATDFLPTPSHTLREMQSFESGRTARQADPVVTSSQKETSSESPTKSPSPSPSFSSVKRAPSPPPLQDTQEFLPLPETCMHSRYSTDVFDVLQTYRGLPRLDKLSLWSGETTVIKMSLSADDSAAPRDDPRFVIWGEFVPERDQDDLSVSQGSFTDLSSSAHSSIISTKKRNTTKGSGPPAELPSVSLTSGQGTQKVVVAATIERWIAQLTSELNYDELLNFFLTYRTYITAVDLCHLLICRFHWALGRHSSSQDERVRRIVRVRTFVAIRYWLLTFFVVDFVPNRELRLLVADWLNTLARDPILEKHNDGLSIVRKLKKVVKDCKAAHTPSSAKTTSTKRRVSKKPPKTTHVLGEMFAEAIASQDEDSDVDLDFLPDEVPPAVSTTPGGHSGDLPNAHLHVRTLSPTAAFPLAALSVLQQSPPMTDLTEASPLPIHHNAISRAFVNTIGRLGRWKRVVLNARSAAVRPPLTPCAGVSAFDLDVGGGVARGNLLTLNSGVEQYLKMIEQQSPAVPLPDDSVERPSLSLSVSSSFSVVEPAVVVVESPPAEFADVVVIEREQPKLPVDATEPDGQVLVIGPQQQEQQPSSPTESDPVKSVPTAEPILPQEEAMELSEMASIRSSSTDSLGKPLSPRSRAISIIAPVEPPPWQFDVVSIDDLDFSDTSSGYDVGGAPIVPPGLRKVPRKLPLRRDFEFVPRSESGASTDIHLHDSMASGATNSVISRSSVDGDGGLGGTIQPWQMTALVDSLSDDEEGGDVEAALRRLEGQINPKKKQEKASKVDGWVRTIQERLAAGDYSNDQSRFPDDDDDNDDDDDDGDDVGEQVMDDIVEDDSSGSEGLAKDQSVLNLAITPPAPQSSHETLTLTSPTSPHELDKPNNILKDVISTMDFLPKRISARLSTSEPPPKRYSLSLKFGNSDLPLRAHRSFILAYRAETLVEHFSMIDRDLFMGIKFEELVLHDWTSCEEVDVLDWMQFLKDRMKWKSESLWPQKTTALAAIRARFNLIANFTLSEVVLTQPTERALVVGKFIRIAWKAYSLRNFHTLVAIIAGLQSEWVSKAMRRSWNRIGIWETRMFKDLKEFTTSADDFRYIRRAVEAIADADAKSMDIGSCAGSVISSGAADGQSGKGRTNAEVKPPARSCIPFIGVYLSELHRLGQLPDLIDPTAPNEAVRIDPITSNFDAPAHPEVFSPLALLPPSMQLEPLINVHKQRLIAGVIKSLVAGQHHASRVQFSVDKKIFQKCLKLRALDSETLHRVLARYPD